MDDLGTPYRTKLTLGGTEHGLMAEILPSSVPDEYLHSLDITVEPPPKASPAFMGHLLQELVTRSALSTPDRSYGVGITMDSNPSEGLLSLAVDAPVPEETKQKILLDLLTYMPEAVENAKHKAEAAQKPDPKGNKGPASKADLNCVEHNRRGNFPGFSEN